MANKYIKTRTLFSLILVSTCCILHSVKAQPIQQQLFKPEQQPKNGFAYFKPTPEQLFAGDPMALWDNGTYHVYYLLDYKNSFSPWGQHIFAHMSSSDLINWKHYPIAIPLDTNFEKSICTGSIFKKSKDSYYGFYAARTLESNTTDTKREAVRISRSKDGIIFDKSNPKELILPSEFDHQHMRDPHVFYDSLGKKYIMVVTTAYNYVPHKSQYGVLIHYTSFDLENWTYNGVFYAPGSYEGFSIPECSDLFYWKGWYYLIYKVNGGNFVRKSRNASGPWEAMVYDNISSDFAMVFKSAAFTNNRRIAVGFVPSRVPAKDEGTWSYAGNLILREYKQLPNGDIVTCIPPETKAVFGNEVLSKPIVTLREQQGFGFESLGKLSFDGRMSLTVNPKNVNDRFGIILRRTTPTSSKVDYTSRNDLQYTISFSPKSNKVCIGNNCIDNVPDLDKPFTLQIIAEGSVIEVEINGKRCHVNRCPEQTGVEAGLFVINAEVEFRNIKVFIKN